MMSHIFKIAQRNRAGNSHDIAARAAYIDRTETKRAGAILSEDGARASRMLPHRLHL